MRTEARLTLEDLLLSAGGFESREVAEECLAEISAMENAMQAFDAEMDRWKAGCDAAIRRREADMRARLDAFDDKWRPYRSAAA